MVKLIITEEVIFSSITKEFSYIILYNWKEKTMH